MVKKADSETFPHGFEVLCAMRFPKTYSLILASFVSLTGCSGDNAASTSDGGGGGISSSSSGGSGSGSGGGSSGGGGGGSSSSSGGGISSSGGSGISSSGGSGSGGGSGSISSSGGNSSTKVITGGSAASGGNVSTGGASAATGGKSSTGGASAATGGKSSTGGATGAAGSSAYHPCPTDGTPCKIMPFGDSITDGYNADTPGGYRVELFRLAHSAGKNITFVGSGWNGPDTVDGVAFPHNHEGHSGWTIYPAGGRMGISSCLSNTGNCGTSASNPSVMTTYTPHIVLLMIGTNDCIDSYDLTNAPTRLGNLITTIYSQLPNVFIVVAQPIPSRGDSTKGDDTGLSARLKTYGDAIPSVVKTFADAGKHIQVVDMWTPFNPNKAALLEDQWHPNLAGYVLLGTQWYSVLQSLL